ncbi:MAG: oligosaccharide flippase family protein [Candidatus Pacebacteria bacterium]|nr:oligosaccharide flippase family protein [Candidatus Paceibacterota bacterium]
MGAKNKIRNWLLWSQKYTQTDMLYLTKGGFWLLMGQAVSTVANILLTMAFANWLSKETFGTYKYVLSLLGILSIPSLSGMNTAAFNAAAKGEDGSCLAAFKLKLKWGFWGSLASLIVAGYYFLQGNQILAVCFLIVACFLPFFNSFSLYDSFLAGKKRFDLQNKFSIINQVASLAFLGMTLYFTKNIFLILLAYFLPLTLLYILFFYLTKKNLDPQGKTSAKTLSFGKHLSLMGIVGNISSQLDKIILWHFLGPVPLAVYSITMMMPDKIKDILKIIGSLAMPKLVVRPLEELQKSIPKKTVQLFALAIPAMILYIIIAPFAFKWFFPQYSQYVIYSQVYALIFLFYPRLLAGSVISAKQKTKALYLSALILTPVYWILLLALIPSFGLWGAIVSFLALEAVTFALQWVQFRHISHANP